MEGKSIAIESRSAAWNREWLPDLADHDEEGSLHPSDPPGGAGGFAKLTRSAADTDDGGTRAGLGVTAEVLWSNPGYWK